MSQNPSKPNGVGLSKLAILIALVVIIAVATGGVVIRPEKSVEKFGFASVSCIGLTVLLKQDRAEAKVAEVKAVAEELSHKTDAQAQMHQVVLLEIKKDVNSNTEKMIDQQRANSQQVAGLQNQVASLKVELVEKSNQVAGGLAAMAMEPKKEGG
jgi:hypothetical protein